MHEQNAGAGKSTLLDILAMRKTGGQLSGMITVNGRRMPRARFRSISTYVPQVTPVFCPPLHEAAHSLGAAQISSCLCQ